jgi:predicted aspartyl protease
LGSHKAYDEKKERAMGRIVTSVRIENILNRDSRIRCDALVDTGASHMVLPMAWRDRLGDLTEYGKIQLELANQETAEGAVCGPVEIQIGEHRPVYTEVVFVDMEPKNGDYEPLVGYIPLEQSQLAVDMLGHRLDPVKYLDLK